MTDPIPTLASRIPEGGTDADGLMEIFIDWTIDRGLELYEAQEEAILEIFGGNHVVLNTPTGSGKSLVGLAMHFFAFANGQRSYYTSPIKALVSEKFFDLCKHFGADNVGMLTGDASINHTAPIICCTQEILAATSLSQGNDANVDFAIVDEFHYYGDRDRGMAWQLPLLLLSDTTFMLMSATLGDPKAIADRLEDRTGRPVSVVRSTIRPVPLEFVYSTNPLLETIQRLSKDGKAPLYVVNFTQRDCAELAQSLTSTNFCTKEEKKALKAEMKGSKFDTPYGKIVRKYLNHGIAVHHGGLLPKYRLLVERLGQLGMLKVICGTDTLGVGINLPIRTVIFSKLCKFDGEKVRLLKVRDFKQIAGRAGRKGFDDEGLVLCQAPEHVIDNLRIAARISGDPKKKKKLRRKGPPEKGYVHWDEKTFNRLIESDSELLRSRFTVNHAMLLDLLQRPEGSGCGYKALIDLVALSHDNNTKKSALRRKARMLFQSLQQAGILEVAPKDDGRRGQKVQLSDNLQHDFSIHHSLSLFLVDAVGQLDREADDYHLKVLSIVEAILEQPWAVLRQQQYKMRTIAIAQMKAEGIEYEERMEKLEEVTWPMPDKEENERLLDHFAETRPWVSGFELQHKSVVRDMIELYASFNEYVREYNLERSEGVLLRHISQTYKALKQNIPENLKTDAIFDLIATLRQTLSRADSSLVRAWEAMRVTDEDTGESVEVDGAEPLLDEDLRSFGALVRAELRDLVRALSRQYFDEVVDILRESDDQPLWTEQRIADALDPYYEVYKRIQFNDEARNARHVTLEQVEPGRWTFRQTLCDPEGDNIWHLSGRVDVTPEAMEEDDERYIILDAIDA